MSNDIRLLQLSSYIRPALEENKSKNWVLNGRNNSFYDYVIKRFNGSPTNAAIITSYIDLIFGKGIAAYNKDMISWVKFLTILSPKELRKIIADFEMFGEASMQIIKTKDGKDLANIYHIPKQLVVPAIENEEGEIETYWYSKDWSKLVKNPPVPFPAFGTSTRLFQGRVVEDSSEKKGESLLASTPVVVLSAILGRTPTIDEYKTAVEGIDLTKFAPPIEKAQNTSSAHF